MRNTLLLLSLTLFAAACGTMTDRLQTIPVRSTPDGANVQLTCGTDTSNQGVTPATVVVRRDSPTCSISVSKEGFITKNVPLERVPRIIAGDIGLSLAFGAVGGLALFIPIAAATAHTERDWGRAYMIGFALTAPIPLFIDAHTGAMYQHVPSDIHVTLEAKQP